MSDLLEVNDLKKYFPMKKGIIINRQIGAVKAVDGIDFSIPRGETFGLVGESGCVGDAGKGSALVDEPAPSFLDAEGAHVLSDRAAVMSPEDPGHVDRMHADVLGECGHPHRGPELGVKPVTQGAQPGRGSPFVVPAG